MRGEPSSPTHDSARGFARAAGATALALSLALSLAASLTLGGCVESAIAAAGATAGFGLAQGQAESFIRGELKSARLVPIETGRAAVLQAMADLRLEVREHRIGEHDGYIRGKADGGREIKVYLRADSPVMTRFSIRIGIMGDSAVASLVMARIDAALGTEAAHSTSAPARD